LRINATAFHSRSAGGRLAGLLKYTSYSIFRRRSNESRWLSSSSMVKGAPSAETSVGTAFGEGQMPGGHERKWTKVTKKQLRATGLELRARNLNYRRSIARYKICELARSSQLYRAALDAIFFTIAST